MFEQWRCDCDFWQHNSLFLHLADKKYKIWPFTYCPYCWEKMKRTDEEKKAAKIFGVKP